MSNTITSITVDTDSVSQIVNKTRGQKTGAGKGQSVLAALQGRDWYRHSCFDNYWTHYHHAMKWCKLHNQVHKKMDKSSNKQKSTTKPSNNYMSTTHHYNFPYGYGGFSPMPMFDPYMGYYSQHGRGRGYGRGMPSSRGSGLGMRTNIGKVVVNSKKRSKHRSSQKHLKSKKHKLDKTEHDGETTGVETHSDSEEYEMEITEEMKEFFAKSEEHKKERGILSIVTILLCILLI